MGWVQCVECRARCENAPSLADIHIEECICLKNMYMSKKKNSNE